MRAIVFLPDRDSKGKRDFTGAFLPESLAFSRFHGVAAADRIEVSLGIPKPARAAAILAALDARSKDGIDLVAFFCHGLPNSLPQFGIGAEQLGAAIASTKRPGVIVVLYACSTGDGAGPNGDNGFADRLRDQLCRNGAMDCAVFSHTTAGHAVTNPHVRVFVGDNSPVGGTGGSWVVAPGSSLWPAWRKALRETDLRYRFPVMSIGDVHRELGGDP